MQLSYDDLKLIKYLFECEFLTREQINNYILKDISNRQIDNIISKLKEFKFIKTMRNPFEFINEDYIYSAEFFAEHSLLNEKTHNKFKKMCNEFELHYIDPIKYRLFEKETFNNRTHDYFLNNVRFMLENIGAKNWIPEYILRKKYNKINNDKEEDKKIPDGLIEDKLNIAIEVERTLKSPKRYMRIFKKYHNNFEKDIDLVIYVVVGEKSQYIYDGLERFLTPELKKRDTYKIENKFNNVKLTDNFYENYFVIKYEDLKKGKYVIENTYNEKKLYIPDIL